MQNESLLVMNLSIDIMFKIVLTKFTKIGKLIYIVIEVKKATFAKTSLIR